MINIRIFLSENSHFLVVKFPVYLNRRVFVMQSILTAQLCLNWFNNQTIHRFLHIKINECFISPQNHMLWVLIKSCSQLY